MNSRKHSSKSKIQYTKLEQRNLLAGVFLNSSTGVLTVFGDPADNTGTAANVGTDIRIISDIGTRLFPASDVTQLEFIGFGGDDTYTNNTDIPANMYGQAGNDTLTGGSADDVIIGGSGDDILSGLAGNDRLVGANGNDLANGGPGNDLIFGSAGVNELRGGNDDDIIFGGDDVDTIFGNSGIDKIYALGGDDIIDSGSGGVAGSTGTDQADLVLGLGGDDTITGGGGLDVFWGGGGDDTMTGGNGENRIHGQAGDDIIVGGNRDDFLRGLADNDTIDGGGGEDHIDLGIGDDDMAIFTDDYADFDIEAIQSGQRITIAKGAISETVIGAEFVQFSDREINSDQAVLATVEGFSHANLNTERASQGMPIFSHPTDLTEYAENWAKDMSVNGFRHSSEADLRKLLVNGRTTFGENIIFIPDTGQSLQEVADRMHSDWMGSTVHRNNIENTAFTEVGVGIFLANGGYWGVHVFYG